MKDLGTPAIDELMIDWLNSLLTQQESDSFWVGIWTKPLELIADVYPIQHNMAVVCLNHLNASLPSQSTARFGKEWW